MASHKQKPPNRTNKTLGVGDLVNKLIDPALKKRGFASQDILENWHIIAPPPYNDVSIPDALKWRRGQAGADGALLFLRCHVGHRLGLAHDHQRIAEAVNRYFGYVLVNAVKLSAEPFRPRSADKAQSVEQPTQQVKQKVNAVLEDVKDDEIRHALEKLGHGVMK